MFAVSGEVVVASPKWRVRRRFSLRVKVVYGIDEVLDCNGVVPEMCSIVDSWICPILRSEIGDTSCGGGWPGASAMSDVVRHQCNVMGRQHHRMRVKVEKSSAIARMIGYGVSPRI